MIQAADQVRFRAEIAWLGPIMSAPLTEGGRSVVKIVGAEDPALGKSFAAALVPVKQSNHHFQQSGTASKFDADSDVNGWFALESPVDLWQGVEGVLLILLYSVSGDLQYWTYQNVDASVPYDPGASAVISRVNVAARILPDMTEEMKKRVKAAIDDEIACFLRRETAEKLLDGLVQLRLPKPLTLGEMPTSAALVFAIGSCQYPTAMLEHEVSGASYARLGKRIDRDDPQCVLLVGDQIYVDGTAGLFDPTSQFDRYVRPYELFFRMPPVRKVLRRLPLFTMMDDHEIRNNWEPSIDDKRPDPAMIDGRRSYVKFERRAGPPMLPQTGTSHFPLWYPFEVNGFPLFMIDTRTERTPRMAGTVATAQIVSEGQMKALLDWLSEPSEMPKIIASPAMLLPRHARAVQRKRIESALRSDGWDGYPRSLHRVLAFIARSRIPNVVFLSGDEHLGCIARIEIALDDEPPILVHSVHSSPLFAPFPFANTIREDLVADDRFDFKDPAKEAGLFHCSVETEFAPPGDGFALLRFYHDGVGWKLNCEFDRAPEEGVVVTTFQRSLALLSRRETRR